MLSTVVVFCLLVISRAEKGVTTNTTADSRSLLGGILQGISEGISSVQWKQLPGANFLHISAKGNQLWAINKLNQILHWKQDSASEVGGHWEIVPGRGHRIAAAADGRPWLINHYTSTNTFRYNPEKSSVRPSTPWESINENLVHVSAVTGDNVVGIDDWGCLAKFDNVSNRFVISNTDCNIRQISIGSNNEQWKIDANENVYRLQNNHWSRKQFPSGAKKICVDRPDRIAVLGSDGVMSVLDATGLNFEKILPNVLPACPICGPIHDIVASDDHIFCIDSNGNVYAYNVSKWLAILKGN